MFVSLDTSRLTKNSNCMWDFVVTEEVPKSKGKGDEYKVVHAEKQEAE